jgi:hypothetical protein
VHTPTDDKSVDTKDRFYEELKHISDQFLKYHMKIMLGDSNAKIGREGIFKPTVGNEILHDISNDIGVRIVNFVTSKNLWRVQCSHHNIHKYTWASDRKTQNQVDHTLTDKKRHSNIVDTQSFRGADCDTDHYLVIVNVRDCQ